MPHPSSSSSGVDDDDDEEETSRLIISSIGRMTQAGGTGGGRPDDDADAAATIDDDCPDERVSPGKRGGGRDDGRRPHSRCGGGGGSGGVRRFQAAWVSACVASWTFAIVVNYRNASRRGGGDYDGKGAGGSLTNELLSTFEKVMSNATLTLGPGYDSYVPFLLEDGRVLCRSSHMEIISERRVRSFLEMVTLGTQLKSNIDDDAIFSYDAEEGGTRMGGLPVLAIERDGSGCFHRGHPVLIRHPEWDDEDDDRCRGRGPSSSSSSSSSTSSSPRSNNDGPVGVDRVPFPRLAWHTPAPKHGTGWCAAIGMPGYEPWRMVEKLGMVGPRSWDRRFAQLERMYPWQTKIETAVWRGSTTGLEANFDDLPRARLVREGMRRPDIIDAGFIKPFVMGWEDVAREELIANKTRIGDYIVHDDLMRHRAIIDIDGTTWSSRFPKLLCTNSVVIKVRVGAERRIDERWHVPHAYYSVLSASFWRNISHPSAPASVRSFTIDRSRLRRILLRRPPPHVALRPRVARQRDRGRRIRPSDRESARDE